MIKLIATDMDGTWLKANKTYDHELFKKDFDLMKNNNIKFVIASGNQYENIFARFPKEYSEQMYFVAENGALVAAGRQILKIENLSPDLYELLLKIADESGYPSIVAALTSAYVLKKDGKKHFEDNKRYFRNIKQVDSYDEVDDRVFKVSLIVPKEEMPEVLANLKEKYPQVGFVAGGYDSIDMSTPGMNKAFGLKYLSQKLGIESQDMVSFGDSENDVAMLKYTGQSFVTSTALPVAKKAAKQIIGSSEDSSVQKEIIHLLER
ncbi:Cof-type HAD-IIB family hydrolase [uncultured Lactobacillus sp.]|uniref:Cof-type HAD-IIB family hydrolase n=1 Tax=uncultured Lactobacillus sp. TaxID=153152 RepID=UPI0026338E92|nr:Cof-type HAD-IIB family hydrolase [uncultured Lactobacillus sp.]